MDSLARSGGVPQENLMTTVTARDPWRPNFAVFLRPKFEAGRSPLGADGGDIAPSAFVVAQYGLLAACNL